MISTNVDKIISSLAITLGSLTLAIMGIEDTHASWTSMRCKVQCSDLLVRSNTDRLNNCAKNCNPADILKVIVPDCVKLNKENHSNLMTWFHNKLKEKEELKNLADSARTNYMPGVSTDKLTEQQKKRKDQLFNEWQEATRDYNTLLSQKNICAKATNPK